MPIKLPEDSTRGRILHFIKTKGRAAISEMSRAFRITPVAVGRHVRDLEDAGLLRIHTERRPRGRPAAVCSLTDSGDALFPRTYDRLSAELMHAISALDGERKIDRVLALRNDEMIKHFAPRMKRKGREARVKELVAILCEQGYMAEYQKKDARTFIITEHNCPIGQIARLYPQTCWGETAFLEQMLNARVRRQEHAVKGDTACSYCVEFAEPRSARRA